MPVELRREFWDRPRLPRYGAFCSVVINETTRFQLFILLAMASAIMLLIFSGKCLICVFDPQKYTYTYRCRRHNRNKNRPRTDKRVVCDLEKPADPRLL